MSLQRVGNSNRRFIPGSEVLEVEQVILEEVDHLHEHAQEYGQRQRWY